MDENMQLYYDYTVSPLGQLFYQTVWRQLEDVQNKRVLDFGSGFGFTSNHLASTNEVTALERNASMLAHRVQSQPYTQIHGDLTALTDVPDASYDVVICHLVLEFVPDPKEILDELTRVLKPGGILSVVRHNKNGRILQAIVQDYDLADATHLLDGGHSFSSAFGDIRYYGREDLLAWAGSDFVLSQVYGVRSLASLHPKSLQTQADWGTQMLSIEQTLSVHPDFIPIAFFQHTLLQKCPNSASQDA